MLKRNPLTRVHAAVAVVWLSVSLVACEEQPGQTFHGVVNAEAPLTLPLSGEKACVARFTLSRGADTSSGGTSVDTLEHQWADGSTLTIDGQTHRLAGEKGNPSYRESGDEWRWNRSFPDKKPPPDLWGWGHDFTFDALASTSGHLGTRYVSVTEEYSPCGSRISVRAIRHGDTLELVDTNQVDSTNAIRTALGVFAGFMAVPLSALGEIEPL